MSFEISVDRQGGLTGLPGEWNGEGRTKDRPYGSHWFLFEKSVFKITLDHGVLNLQT